LTAFVRGSLPPPPARVLEIGAGKGELAGVLSDAGYAMTAIDPAAEPGGVVRRCSLLETRGSFDVAVAVVSLTTSIRWKSPALTWRRCSPTGRRW
jgi:hypothetical protein